MDEYGQVCVERDALKLELEELKNSPQEPETVQVTLKGTFTATVRTVFPNYTTDGVTPSVVAVTLFQCPPFLISWNGDIAGQVEEGKTYVFEVTDQLLEIPLTEYERNFPDPEWLFPQYVIHLSGFREAAESDYGLDSVHLDYELCDKT